MWAQAEAELAARAAGARKRNAIERAHFAPSDVLSPRLAGLFGTRVHELFQLPAWPTPCVAHGPGR